MQETNPTSKTMKDDNYLTSDTFNHTVLEESKLLFAKLMKRIESIESSAVNKIVQKQEFMAEASLAILDLKRLQRRILNRVTKSEKMPQQQVVVAQKQQLKLDNLMYQHLLNLASIERCTASVKNTESSDLYKLALATKVTTEHVGISDAASVYLLGTDWKDPQQRHVILSILNREITSRQTLEQQLAQCEKELASRKEVLAAKRKLLNELPNKLTEMEKASVPLQMFSHKSLDLTPTLSSQRCQRLDFARTLPKPLYVLFHQLQSCLDLLLHRNENNSDGKVLVGGKESLPQFGLVSEASEDPAVQLKIPIPTISEGGNISFTPEKTATLSFHFCASIGVVTAYCINESGMTDETVIGELFPGDTGEWMPRIDTAVVASSGNGLPYNSVTTSRVSISHQLSKCQRNFMIRHKSLYWR